jgi:hypothetical protein
MTDTQIIVIGGGASGMAAAISAARAGASVMVVEKNEKIGRKILSTGNGRCNFTNADMGNAFYYGASPRFVDTVLNQFGVEDTVHFFEEEGMLCIQKNGYYYPSSMQASTVRDLLERMAYEAGVHLVCDCKVTSLVYKKKEHIFELRTSKGTYRADGVIVAAGGKSAPKLGSDGSINLSLRRLGHNIVAQYPALCALYSDAPYTKHLAGVRADAAVTLYIDDKKIRTFHGEIQFTDYGISGIVVFQLSRLAAYALEEKKTVRALVDLFPNDTTEHITRYLNDRAEHFKGRGYTIQQYMQGILHEKLVSAILTACRLKNNIPLDTLGSDTFSHLCDTMKHLTFPVTATADFERSQVTAGGIDTNQLEEGTLISKICPNLAFAGEIIDVDGICGGYNLQWAWSSGYVAGKSLAKQLNSNIEKEQPID